MFSTATTMVYPIRLEAIAKDRRRDITNPEKMRDEMVRLIEGMTSSQNSDNALPMEKDVSYRSLKSLVLATALMLQKGVVIDASTMKPSSELSVFRKGEEVIHYIHIGSGRFHSPFWGCDIEGAFLRFAYNDTNKQISFIPVASPDVYPLHLEEMPFKDRDENLRQHLRVVLINAVHTEDGQLTFSVEKEDARWASYVKPVLEFCLKAVELHQDGQSVEDQDKNAAYGRQVFWKVDGSHPRQFLKYNDINFDAEGSVESYIRKIGLTEISGVKYRLGCKLIEILRANPVALKDVHLPKRAAEAMEAAAAAVIAQAIEDR